MSDYLIGHIRTYVPIVVGAFIAWLTTKGIEVTDAGMSGLVLGLTALLQGIYYGLVRALAEKWPVFGKLLGKNIAPSYNGS